jgi:hypothetical protein
MSKVTVNPLVTCIDDFYPITLYNTSILTFMREFLYPLLNLKDTENMKEADCNELNDKRMTYIVLLGVSSLTLFIVLLTFIIYYFLKIYNFIEDDTEINEERTKKIESILLDIIPNENNQVELNINSSKNENSLSNSDDDNKSSLSDNLYCEQLNYFRPQKSNNSPLKKYHDYEFVFPLPYDENENELHLRMLLSQLTARNESVEESVANKAFDALTQTYEKTKNFSQRIVRNFTEIAGNVLDHQLINK